MYMSATLPPRFYFPAGQIKLREVPGRKRILRKNINAQHVLNI